MAEYKKRYFQKEGNVPAKYTPGQWFDGSRWRLSLITQPQAGSTGWAAARLYDWRDGC